MKDDTASLSLTNTEWLLVAGVGVVVVGVGAVLAWKQRTDSRVNALGNPLGPNPLRALPSPGEAAFHRVLFNGVRDGDLQYGRAGMTGMLYHHKTFNDAKLLGISPTELAVSGKLFGDEVLPIRIEVHADGSVRLADGRRRYTAAKEAGASAILADVLLYDNEGDVVMDRRSPVSLL